MDGGGGRRGRNASRSDRAKAKLSNLLALRKGGAGARTSVGGDVAEGHEDEGEHRMEGTAGIEKGARAKNFKLKEEEAIFDVVDDVEYTAIVTERRNKYGDFVVNDGGTGYVDIGEEDDWNVDYYKDEEAEKEQDQGSAGSKKRKQGQEKEQAGKNGKKKKSKQNTLLSDALNNNKKLDKMFLAATAAGPQKGAPVTKSIGQQLGQSNKTQQMEGQADALLEDILGDLDCNVDDANLQQERIQLQPTKPVRQTPASAPRFARANVLQPKRQAAARPQQAQAERKVHFEEQPSSVVQEEADVVMDVETVENTEVPDVEIKTNQVDKAVKVKEEVDVRAPSEAPAEDESQESEKPIKSAWESMCEDEVNLAVENQTEAEKTEKDSSAMEVDMANQPSQESLDFYFVDLHSENSMGTQMKGSVYMFGKVRDGKGGWQSCSVIVRNMLRNLFFVPQSSLLSKDVEAIEEMETRVKEGDKKARGDLMKFLHGKFTDLKNEIRDILTRNGIHKFTLVPVKRDYAFELAEIPRGMQWVIKVKYSAQLPELNPDSVKGVNFCGMFGAKTSNSEHLILKRKLKGPGWLKVSSPRRVETQNQITWSKHEFEVDSPKSISVCEDNPTDNKKSNSSHPPLTVAAVNVKTFVGPNQSTPEIVSCTVMYLKQVQTDLPTPKDQWNTLKQLRHFSCVRRLDGLPFPIGFEKECQQRNASSIGKLNGNSVISHFNSERALLCNVIARLRALDPDVLVGHNVLAFDLDVLYSRMIALKVPHWSRIGRIKRSSLPFGTDKKKGSNQGNTLLGSTITTGRLVCDTYLSAREFVRQSDYSLKSLSSSLLGETKVELQMDMSACFSSTKDLLQLVTLAEQDTWLSLGLMFHLSILPLSRQLTNLSGFQWAKVLRGGRAQRIEYLLLHEFHSRKFMVPDKQSYQSKKNGGKEGGSNKRGKAQYAGGLVLDPKCGLYDDFVLMLDFNSLYPSIIQEYNICFTTVERPQDSETMASLPPAIGRDEQLAILPSVIRRLVQRRRQVKTMLKEERDESKKQQLDIRQQALKLTANSMYGCLGFSASRFCARPLAELVTSQGREILQNTANLAEQNLNLEVVYGDTDSIFVNTRSKLIDEVKRLGNSLRKEVNKRYKLLEIEIDAIFMRLLLLKKKKYAAIKLEPSRTKSKNGQQEYVQVVEHKGIDIVRRDWSVLSKEVGAHVLELILSGRNSEEVLEMIHTHMQAVGDKVRQSNSTTGNAYMLDKFIITKQLTKRPEDYPDWRSQPHVQVAMRRKKLGKRDGVNPGETIQYVICEQPSSQVMASPQASSPSSTSASSSMLAERAFHPEEIMASRNKSKGSEGGTAEPLKVDVQYYLAQQVHPVVSRLCEPIEGTSAARLADCLGLDSAKYHRQDVQGGGQRSEDALFSSAGSFEDEQRYKVCKPLQIAFPDGTHKDFSGVSEFVKQNNQGQGEDFAHDLLSIQMKASPVKSEPVKKEGDGEVPVKKEEADGDNGGETYTLSAAQLKNQTQLQMHKLISDYYDGVLVVDDGFGLVNETRSVSLRVDPQHTLGHMPADIKISNPVTQKMNESSLYLQLSHYSRLLDTKKVFEKLSGEKEHRTLQRQLASISEQVDSACQLVQHTKDRSQFKWGFDKSFWKRACGISQ